MKGKKGKSRLFKYCSFSYYDMEYLKIWLENLSKEGLVLSGSGFLGPFAIVEKKDSGVRRYQLLSSVRKTKDDNEMVRMIQDTGWDPICNFYITDIYMTEDSNAPELHSDSEVQMMELRHMEKRSMLWLGILCLLTVINMIVHFHQAGISGGGSVADNVCGILMAFLWIALFFIQVRGYNIQGKRIMGKREVTDREYRKYACQKNLHRISMLVIIILILIVSCLIYM